MDIEIIHIDESFVVIEKPSGMLSVPGRGPDKQISAMSHFLEKFPDAIAQPSIHRLDMATSGLLVVARTKFAHKTISRQFQDRVVKKSYFALIDGHLQDESGYIELAFRVDIENRPHQMYDPIHGKLGITDWKRLGYEGQYTRVEFNPLTGRTHQLRVHSAHELGLGHPIVGDFLYGTGTDTNQLKLHAAYLGFNHPHSGEWIEFRSNPPF